MKKLAKFGKLLLLLFFLVYAGTHQSFAQTEVVVNEWNFLSEIYIMFPNIDGETGIGNEVTVDVDANTSDVFEQLKFGAMVYLEAGKGKWSITSDLVYMDIEKDVLPNRIINSGSINLDQFIWEIAGLYSILPILDVGIGGRLVNLKTDIEANRRTLQNGDQDINAGISETFYDPVIISRFKKTINNRWPIQIRGDLGGFGIGSDFTWQLQAYAGYRFTELFQITVGYRSISFDYDKGTDRERFIFDMVEQGPVLRLGFNF